VDRGEGRGCICAPIDTGVALRRIELRGPARSCDDQNREHGELLPFYGRLFQLLEKEKKDEQLKNKKLKSLHFVSC
jgi:hypothetical protein